jgi:WD40 repeat protein
MQTIAGHKQAVTSMAFGPEGRALISGSADGAVVLRDLHVGAPLTMAVQEPSSQAAAKRNPFYRIDTVALSSDGKTLAWESTGGRIVLWDVPTGTVRSELAGTASVASLTFTPDGKTLAAGTEKGVVLWDVATGSSVRPPVEYLQTVNPRIFADNGKIMALKTPDHSVMLWDVPKAEPRGAPRRGHASALTTMAFSPAGDILASASADSVVLLWDVASERPRQPSLGGHEGEIVDLTFSAAGNTLAVVAYRDRQSMVTLWDIARGQRRDLLRASNIIVESLVFSPDGNILIGAAQSGELVLWDVAHPEATSSRLRGHSTRIGALAFSQEGDLLISVAGDTAIVWDIRTRMAIGRVSDSQRARAVVFNRDSRVMVASSEMGCRVDGPRLGSEVVGEVCLPGGQSQPDARRMGAIRRIAEQVRAGLCAIRGIRASGAPLATFGEEITARKRFVCLCLGHSVTLASERKKFRVPFTRFSLEKRRSRARFTARVFAQDIYQKGGIEVNQRRAALALLPRRALICRSTPSSVFSEIARLPSKARMSRPVEVPPRRSLITCENDCPGLFLWARISYASRSIVMVLTAMHISCTYLAGQSIMPLLIRSASYSFFRALVLAVTCSVYHASRA